MDEFGGGVFNYGDVIDVELYSGLVYDEESQNSMLDSNLNVEKKMAHLSGWSYRAYGVVTSIKDETIIDVGFCRLAAPFETSIVGECIAFTIIRLDAHAVIN